MARQLIIKSDDFKQFKKNMSSFSTGFKPFLRGFMGKLAEGVIDEAIKEKPTLAGRSGQLNESWTYTKPRYRGDELKTTVQNLAPYALVVEEGVKSPNPNWVRGYFSPSFRTGHGLPMFFPSGDAFSKFYFMPTKPWEGFFMLEKAIKTKSGEVDRELSNAFNAYINSKGLR